MRTNAMLPNWIFDVLACPYCRIGITRTYDSQVTCDKCLRTFPKGPQGQPDFRLSTALAVSLPVKYDPVQTSLPESLWVMPPSIALEIPKALEIKGRSEIDVKAWIAGSIAPDQIVVDLGAKSNRDKSLVEEMGAKYLAIELNNPEAMVLGDAHALPLLDESVDVLMCMSVFEHLKNPFLAAYEIKRVLKKSGRFIGIVGFLEPIHGLPHGSYFHQSYLGIYTLLTSTGLNVEYLSVSPRWQAIHPISRTMLAGVPTWITYALVWPLERIQNISWFAYGLKSHNRAQAKAEKYRRLSASVTFVANK